MDRQNDVYFPPNFMQNFQNSPPAIPTPPAAPVGHASAFQPPQPPTSLSGLYDQDVGMEFANAFMQCAEGPGPSYGAQQPMHYPQHARQMPSHAFYPPHQPAYPSMSMPYQPPVPNQPLPTQFPQQYPMPFQGVNSAFAPPPPQYYHQQHFYGPPPGGMNFVQQQDMPGPSHTANMAACGPPAHPMLASPPQTVPIGPPQMDHQQQTFIQPPAQDVKVDVKARMTPHEVPTDILLSHSYDSPPQPSTSFALSALNVDNFTSDSWIASFRQMDFHSQQLGGSVQHFHASWPEYAGVEQTFTKKRDRYVKLKEDVNGSAEASVKEKEAMNAELFCAKIEFEKAIRRLDRFVQLVKSRPDELRNLLSRKTGFNEIFRQLPLPGEYVSDHLLNDLFDWAEGQKRHSAYAEYYEKKLEADAAIRYRCLFEGCYFDYVSSSDRKWESVKQKLRIHVLTHIPWKAKKIQSPGQRAGNRRASSASTASTPQAGPSTMVESKVMVIQPGIYGETSTQAVYPVPPPAYEATIERLENAFAAVTEPQQQPATPLSSSNTALRTTAKSTAAKTIVKPEPESSENYSELSALLAEADEFVEASTAAQAQEQTNEPEASNRNGGSVSPSKMTIHMRAVKSENVTSPTKAPEPDKGTESVAISSAADQPAPIEPKREPFENEIVEPEDESVPIPLTASPLPYNSQPINIDEESPTKQREASSQPAGIESDLNEAEPSRESNEAVAVGDYAAASPPSEPDAHQAEDDRDADVLSYAEIDVVIEPAEDPTPSRKPIRRAKKTPSGQQKRQLRSSTSPQKRISSRRVVIESDSEDEPTTTRCLRSQDTESVISGGSEGPSNTAKRAARKRSQPEAGSRRGRGVTRTRIRAECDDVNYCDTTDETDEEPADQPVAKRQLRSRDTVINSTMKSPASSTPTRPSGPRAGSSTRGGELVTDTETSPQRRRAIVSESDESPAKGPPPQRRIGAPPSSNPAPASAPKKRASRPTKAEKSIWDTDDGTSSSGSEYDPTHSDDDAGSSRRRNSGRAKRQDFSARPTRRQSTATTNLSAQPSRPDPAAAAPRPSNTNATVTPKPVQKTGNPLEGEGFYGQFFVHVPLDGGKSRYDCRFGKCSYTYLDTTNRRCALSSHFRSRHAEEYRAQLREKVNEKLEALEEPETSDDSLAADWTDYERLRNEYVSKHEDFKTMATRLQRQGTDEATLVSGLAELDERMKLLDRTRGRLQEFLRFVDEKPAQLRALLDEGSTFNAILVDLRGADEVKDLLDPAEDMHDKNRHRIDYEALFGKRDVEGATWHKCKIERCNYVFGSVSQPTYVLGRRFKEHFAEKHFPRARKDVEGELVEEVVAYEYWEDWAQLRALEAEVENLQQLLEEANQESGPPTAAKRKVIEQYEKAQEKLQTLDALIRHCPVHVHMLLWLDLPAEEVIRRLSCRLPFIQHDDLRNRPVARVISKPTPRAKPTPAQRSTTTTPQPGPSRASATPSRASPAPSTSSASTSSGLPEMPEVALEVRPLTSLMPMAYRQFFAVDGRGYCKCRFVDCDYTYSETGFKDTDHNAMKEHCITEHLS